VYGSHDKTLHGSRFEKTTIETSGVPPRKYMVKKKAVQGVSSSDLVNVKLVFGDGRIDKVLT